MVQTSNFGHWSLLPPASWCVVRDSKFGHQLLLPPANCCPTFASRTTHCEGHSGTYLGCISVGRCADLEFRRAAQGWALLAGSAGAALLGKLVGDATGAGRQRSP